MRWSIIRLIWLRELRDQLRDRRTVFMIVVLPVLLYPVLGAGVVRFASAFLQEGHTVGVSGVEHLPQAPPGGIDTGLLSAAAWLTMAPEGGLDRMAGAAALAAAARLEPLPPLMAIDDEAQLQFVPPVEGLRIIPLPPLPDGELKGEKVDQTPLQRREVDILLVVPEDFRDRVGRGERPVLLLITRPDDPRAPLVRARVQAVLDRWMESLQQVRLRNFGLPVEFGEPFRIELIPSGPGMKQGPEGMLGMLGRVFPFLLVMWSLTGALYPAVDLCAGEKERGTMETLLISPAGREEIVYGKFLTIWVFSAATALLNLGSIALTTLTFGKRLPGPVLGPGALLWSLLLLLPLSAFFSALCLALGAYARSSKEGQYYLMPLFLATMPLIFLTLAPGVELNPLYSLIPVTGVALLLQRLMTVTTLDQVPWGYFIPVLAPTVLYGWLALRWAVFQFHREEVLFREAERLDVRLWLRRLFREKEPLPSPGQALFCFALITGLRGLSLAFGSRLPLLWHTAIDLMAFVITPPLLMALLLTSRPAAGLQLRLPPRRAVLTAVLLAVTVAVPVVESAAWFLRHVPWLEPMLSANDPLAKALLELLRGEAGPAAWWQYPLVLAVLAAVCEEVAFRGFILSGLRRRFKPWTAILLSSFLFAVSHLNVFQFVPLFGLGVILGLLATRSGSIVPGLVFHVTINTLLLLLLMASRPSQDWIAWLPPLLRSGIVLLCAAGAILYLLMSGFRLWMYGPTVHDDLPRPSV
jgi:sodium transport system permease protein